MIKPKIHAILKRENRLYLISRNRKMQSEKRQNPNPELMKKGCASNLPEIIPTIMGIRNRTKGTSPV